MPPFLINLLIGLVVRFGLPYVLRYLHDRFPWLPIDGIRPILDELAEELKINKANKKQSRLKAKDKLKECLGTACPADTKSP